MQTRTEIGGNAPPCNYHVRWDHDHQLWCVQTEEGRPIGWSDSQGAAIIMAAKTASHDHGSGFRSQVCIENKHGGRFS